VVGEAGAVRMAPRTPDMVHTVSPTRLRHNRTTGAIWPPTVSVAHVGGWAEVSLGGEDAVGAAGVDVDVDDGSHFNECSTLVDSIERRR
jgi:hypothetical protein